MVAPIHIKLDTLLFKDNTVAHTTATIWTIMAAQKS